MFWNKRQKVSDHVFRAVQPIVANIYTAIGIPPGFWDDDFVLGYLGVCISFHMNYTSDAKLTHEDKGAIAADVFQRLSSLNGLAIITKFNSMQAESQMRPRFQEGCRNARIVCYSVIGKKQEEGEDDVRSAKMLANEMGRGNDLQAIIFILVTRLFVSPLMEHFKGQR